MSRWNVASECDRIGEVCERREAVTVTRRVSAYVSVRGQISLHDAVYDDFVAGLVPYLRKCRSLDNTVRYHPRPFCERPVLCR